MDQTNDEQTNLKGSNNKRMMNKRISRDPKIKNKQISRELKMMPDRFHNYDEETNLKESKKTMP